MRIIVVGGGEVGYALGRQLGRAHELFVIDHDPAVADRFASLDVQFVLGSGSSPEVLTQARVESCELFIACTGLDEVNILACFVANRLGSPTTICLVSRDDLMQPLGEQGVLREHFGIDRVIWPEAQLAADIQRLIAAPGAIDAEAFAEGQIRLLEYRLSPGSPLTEAPLASLDLPRNSLAVAVKRGDEFTIPRGQTRLASGDKVFIMGTNEAMHRVQQRVVGGPAERAQSVTIIGAGDVGFRLAERLDERPDIDLRVIESDPARGAMVAAALRHALVLHGDGTDLELLESEQIGKSDVMVSVIDNDERNLIASLLGRQLGVRRIITRVGRPANLRLFERVGIDVALSARGAAVAAIVHQVEGGKSKLLAVLEEGQAQVLELVVPDSFPPTGLRDLRPLPESIIGAILRDGVAIVPSGDDELRPGDRLLVFSTLANVDQVRDYFAASPV